MNSPKDTFASPKVSKAPSQTLCKSTDPYRAKINTDPSVAKINPNYGELRARSPKGSEPIAGESFEGTCIQHTQIFRKHDHICWMCAVVHLGMRTRLSNR